MAPRVSPRERVRAETDQLFASDQDFSTLLEQVGRLTVRGEMKR